MTAFPTTQQAQPAVASRVAAAHVGALGGDYAPCPVPSAVDWSGPVALPLDDEPAVQAACGIMHVHGRAAGGPQRLGVDYASALAGVLAAHGTLAASIARIRGAPISSVRTSVAQAALLAVGQYLAVATTDDDWAEQWYPGGRPPFTTRDGVRFELETLYPEGWQEFWQRLGADPEPVAAGWWPFQQRFATASGPLPAELHAIVRGVDYSAAADAAAAAAGVSVLPVRDDPSPPVDVPACSFRPLPGTAGRRVERSGNAPLDGLVVVESTRRIQGPVVGHLLRMLGAEVVRVEPPGGDPMRGVPPVSGDCSARFRVLNDGKRVVELDLKTPSGRRDLHELVAGADAFVHNWAPGKAEQLGLEAEALARSSPGLVHAWSSGWAPLEWAEQPLGTDFLVQAHSGLAAAAYPHEEPAAPSLMTLTDILGGAVCTTGVLAALLRRERTGEGAQVDSSLYSAAGVIPRPAARPAWTALDRPVRTADGFLALPEGGTGAELLGPLRLGAAARPEEIVARFRCETTEAWAVKLAEAGVRATPVCTDLRQLAADPRFTAALGGTTPLPVATLGVLMTECWTSANGVEIRDLVPRELRRTWVAEGLCPGRDLYALFSEHVRAHPDREAVVDGDTVLDFAGLDREVRRIAAALAAAGLGSRDIIGIRMPNGWRMVVAELAVAAIGAVALPYPMGSGNKDTLSLLGRSRAAAGIFGEPADAEAARGLPDVRAAFTFGAGQAGGRALDDAPAADAWQPAPVDAEAPARILVTSGSQSEPKMIAYSHNAMAGGRANYVRALHDGDEPMRGLMLMKLSSSYGSCATSVSLAALGATLILVDRFDPAEVMRQVGRHRPTHLFGVPTMLRRLSEHPVSPDEDLSSLQAVVSSAAPLSDVTAAECHRRFGSRVITIYGSSDGMNCHTARTGTGNGSGTGRPDPSVARIRIVDEQGNDVPTGAAGEIWARGPMTPLCYVAGPELDARHRTAEGWVRSGDRGVLDEHGCLHVLGRLEQVVSRGGYKISPAEVERELSAHPRIVDVACVPVPDDDLGERMCACISQTSGSAALSLADLTAFLEHERGLERRKLPEYVLRLPELPLAPTGKVCRHTVGELAAERNRRHELAEETA